MPSGLAQRAGVALIVGVGDYESGRFQRLPYAARDARAMDKLLVDPDNVVIHGMAMGEVAHLMDAVQAKAVIVILDCCHAGHVLSREGTTSRSPLRDMAIKPAVFEKLTGKNRFLIASCGEGQKSIEAVERKHGLFTYHLLRGIRGSADRDRDGMVGLAELFNYVSGAVARDARDKFKCEQNPWVNGTWTDEIFLTI
jgi:helicase